jgi:hypothetical protein
MPREDVVLFMVCECGATGRFESADAAMDGGWTRLRAAAEGFEAQERWFCPREAPSTIVREASVMTLAGLEVTKDSRVRE